MIDIWTDWTKSLYVKMGSRANFGDMVVKVEVAVHGDAKEFDLIRNVNNVIRYQLERPELIERYRCRWLLSCQY